MLALTLVAGPLAAAGDVARFPGQTFADGTAAPAHSSRSGEPGDAAAAVRRDQLLRSPYARPSRQRPLLAGEIELVLEAGLPADLEQRLAEGLEAAADRLFEKEGWSRPFSPKSPLRALVTGGHDDAPALAAWAGRDAGVLKTPLVAVSGPNAATGRGADAVLLDLVHQIALVSLRQIAPDEAGWATEGAAEWMARRALGYDLKGEPEEGDPFLEASGSLLSPAAAAAFLEQLAARLPNGVAEVRAAWEDAGATRGDDAEAVLRALSGRADPRGLSGLLGDLVAGRSRGTPGDRLEIRGRRLNGDMTVSAPAPLGWRRVSLRTPDERGGLEIALPDGAAAGRAVLHYWGEPRQLDVTPLLPGSARTLPLSGAAGVDLVFVDGGDPAELFVGLRRVPDYPAVLVGSGAEWQDGIVHVRWRTAAHRDLLAWVLARYEETADGAFVEAGRELVPTSAAADSGFDYEVADRGAVTGHRYRYRVYALTRDGLLSEAFEAMLGPGR